MSDKKWYAKPADGEIRGPFTSHELQSYCKHLKGDDELRIRRGKLGRWYHWVRVAQSFKQFAHHNEDFFFGVAKIDQNPPKGPSRFDRWLAERLEHPFWKGFGGTLGFVLTVSPIVYVASIVIFGSEEYQGLMHEFRMLGPFYGSDDTICWRNSGAVFFADIVAVLVWLGRISMTAFLIYWLFRGPARTLFNSSVSVAAAIMFWMIPANALVHIMPETCLTPSTIRLGATEYAWTEVETITLDYRRHSVHYYTAPDSETLNHDLVAETADGRSSKDPVPAYIFFDHQDIWPDYLARFAPHVTARMHRKETDVFENARPERESTTVLYEPQQPD